MIFWSNQTKRNFSSHRSNISN